MIVAARHVFLGEREDLDRVTDDLGFLLAQLHLPRHQQHRLLAPDIRRRLVGAREDRHLDGAEHVLQLRDEHGVAALRQDAANRGDASAKCDLLARPLLVQLAV